MKYFDCFFRQSHNITVFCLLDFENWSFLLHCLTSKFGSLWYTYLTKSCTICFCPCSSVISLPASPSLTRTSVIFLKFKYDLITSLLQYHVILSTQIHEDYYKVCHVSALLYSPSQFIPHLQSTHFKILLVLRNYDNHSHLLLIP